MQKDITPGRRCVGVTIPSSGSMAIGVGCFHIGVGNVAVSIDFEGFPFHFELGGLESIITSHPSQEITGAIFNGRV